MTCTGTIPYELYWPTDAEIAEADAIIRRISYMTSQCSMDLYRTNDGHGSIFYHWREEDGTESPSYFAVSLEQYTYMTVKIWYPIGFDERGSAPVDIGFLMAENYPAFHWDDPGHATIKIIEEQLAND